MPRQKLNETYNYGYYDYTPRKNSGKSADYALSEWRIAVFGLVVSLAILSGKLWYSNRTFLYLLAFEDRLVAYETLTADGEVMLRYTWTTILNYSRFWFPVLCGFFATWFTWLMVYLDSSVPGVQPPSPLSPARYKMQSGHTFHLNYVFAVLLGLLVATYLFWEGISLQF